MTVYKYTDGKPQIVDSLRNGLLRFTQPQFLNDPFEMKPAITSFMSDENLKDSLSETLSDRQQILNVWLSEISNQPDQIKENVLSAFIKNYLYLKEKNLNQLQLDQKSHLLFDALTSERGLDSHKVKDFYATYMREYLPSDFEDRLVEMLGPSLKQETEQTFPIIKQSIGNAIFSNIGVFCVSEKPLELLLWAHYTNGHQGFIIGLDTDFPFYEGQDPFLGLKKVIYQTSRRVEHLVKGTTDEERQNHFISTFFLTKSEHWKYEQEWRMFRTLDKAHTVRDNIFLFKFPVESVNRIIVGSQTSNKLVEDLLKLRNEVFTNASIEKAIPDQYEFKLNIEQLC